jgi:GTPase SAR1 family protein
LCCFVSRSSFLVNNRSKSIVALFPSSSTLIVGEFNAGKSTFINSLLGAEYLKSGVLPTTDKICLLRSIPPGSNGGGDIKNTEGNTSAIDSDSDGDRSLWIGKSNFMLDDIEDKIVPNEWLRNVAVIDTPGTNALLSRHEELTTQIIPRADLILFVTSAERPLSDSEGQFLDKISKWGKKIIIIINKMDTLTSEENNQQVIEYVKTHVSSRLNRIGAGSHDEVPLFPISSKLALSSRLRLDNDDYTGLSQSPEWIRSGVSHLEDYLRLTLSSGTVVKSKLLNPLNVSDRLINKYINIIRNRKDNLQTDINIMELLNENKINFKNDIKRDSIYTKEKIFHIINDNNNKIIKYFYEEITINSIIPTILFDINMNEFKKDILGIIKNDININLNTKLKDIIVDLSEVLTTRCEQQSKTVMNYIGERHKYTHNSTLVRSRLINDSDGDNSGGGGSSSNSGILKNNIDNNENGNGGMSMSISGLLTPSSIGLNRIDQSGRELTKRLLKHCQKVIDDNNTTTNSIQEKRVNNAVKTIRNGYVTFTALNTISFLSISTIFMFLPVLNEIELIISTIASLIPTAYSTTIIPNTSLKVQNIYNQHNNELISTLENTINSVLEQEIHTITELINTSIIPYSVYVNNERRITNQMSIKLEILRNNVRNMKSKLDDLHKNQK